MYRTILVPNTKYLYGLMKLDTLTKEKEGTRINNNPRAFVRQRKEQLYVSDSCALLRPSPTSLKLVPLSW